MLADLEFWRLLDAQIEQLGDNPRQRLLDGLCPDHAAYKEQVGYLKALREVRDAAKRVADAMRGIPGAPPEPQEDDDE